eukprot:2858598-Prorocentrum_lima.AAC.1
MTSSLVGSEMCIRDSCGVLLDAHVFLPCSVSGWWLCTARVAVGVFVAVSYTHLTLPTICSV